MRSELEFLEHKLSDIYAEIVQFQNLGKKGNWILKFHAFIECLLLKIEYHYVMQMRGTKI